MPRTRPQPTCLDQALAHIRRPLLGVALFSGLINLLMLSTPIYMMQVYDRVLSSGHQETLLYLTIIVGVALAVLALLDSMRAWVLSRAGAWLVAGLNERVTAGSILARLKGVPTGSQPQRDLRQIQSFLGGQGLTPLFDLPWIPVFVALLWLLHPWFGLLALIVGISLFCLGVLNEVITRSPLKRAGACQVAGYEHLEALARNAEAIQAMGMMRALTRRWATQDAEATAWTEQATERGALLQGISKFCRLAAQVGVLGLGALLVLDGQLSAGTMIAASILLGRALAPVEQTIGAWKQWVATHSAYDRVQSLLRAVDPNPDAMALPAPTGQLTVEAVAYQPRPDRPPILKGIGFKAASGEMVGLIGPSGSGKSTLCQLLVGLFPPSAGHVRLDGADLHRRNREEIGPFIGYIPQDVELFPGSIAENIARMAADPDAEDVVAAARLAGVHELILQQPKGYDTELGERGQGLSAGQRQRVALARALYRRPTLLVLDEPNANLDAAGDQALQQALQQMKETGTTIVMVAHRLPDLKLADTVLVLRDGTQQAFGPRDQVLRPPSSAKAAAPVRPLFQKPETAPAAVSLAAWS